MKKRFFCVIISALIISTSMLAGCGCNTHNTATADEAPTTVSETHEVSDTSSVAATEATLSATDKAIIDSGLKVDDKGNVVDSNGKKVKTTSDGKVEVKTADGKKVKVDTNEIQSANKNNANNGGSSGSGSAGNKTNNNNSSTNNNSSSSAANSKPNNGTQTNKKPTNGITENNPENSNQNSDKQESSKAEETKHTHSWVDITKQVKVVDQEAYTYEEPVYEQHDRAICKVCGEDITNNRTEHNRNHALNGENVSWTVKSVNVQVGTKTVTVPEEYHYETKITGRKCSSCGKTEYY